MRKMTTYIMPIPNYRGGESQYVYFDGNTIGVIHKLTAGPNKGKFEACAWDHPLRIFDNPHAAVKYVEESIGIHSVCQMNSRIPQYECCECCEVFEETTEFERCPYCGSHHVIDISFDRLLEWMIIRGPDQDREDINSGARRLRNKWGW